MIDSPLRVKDGESLWTVDASVMPRIISGKLKSRAQLPPERSPFAYDEEAS